MPSPKALDLLEKILAQGYMMAKLMFMNCHLPGPKEAYIHDSAMRGDGKSTQMLQEI